ncbi:DUF2851 family protein [Sunxiuqinia sp. A32]|uniref:DUF2851 family protein n=1 Tax=Sunxiuqinia sp. A32 TaxID=3461496 RepID=UPI0040453125
MNEAFLQFIWQHRLYYAQNMQTTDGDIIEIIQPGQHNTDSGPDFFNARIKIGETSWAGNVEIHQKASDWNRHQHEKDAAYDNVILHVVQCNDHIVFNSNKEKIATYQFDYPKHLETNYEDLLKSKAWVACGSIIREADLLELKIRFHSLMIERLQQKTSEITDRLAQNNNDWNETFYQFLARNFGFKTNALPFEMLAKAVPLSILGKHKNDLFQLEALLFGTAGLLNQELLGDDYYLALRKEYSYLFKKYKLKPIEAHLWKFLRLRPVNFPSLRIAQFANLIHQSSALFSRLIELTDLKSIQKLFDISASNYWDNHYRFNKTAPIRKKHLGESAFQNIVINTIVPFLFVYGDYHHVEKLKDLALDYLDSIPPEKNSIISNWEKMGIKASSAFESQALIQLKNCYCNHKKCLNCHLGAKLIKKNIPGNHESTGQ